ncbi:uncharacterized protein BKA78DRAFT_366151 [Phyllosticta capitalensis]|uniref:uncharacterized protein n=1 Tax=Phyllosticta capitalensis TaxID=121624 RepID=UPI00312DA797
MDQSTENETSAQVLIEESGAALAPISNEASSNASSNSSTASETTAITEPREFQEEEEEPDEDDEEEDEEEDEDDDDNNDSELYSDSDSDSDVYEYDPDDDWEQGNKHPRCIYEDISDRDIPDSMKDQLCVTCPELQSLRDAMSARKATLIDMRSTSALRREGMSQDRWEQLLSAEYQRQTRALLDALEADIAYFRKLLNRMVKDYADGRLILPSRKFWRYYVWGRDRIHNEIGGTRADILVLRLRAGPLEEDFVSAFRDKQNVAPEDWTYTDQRIPLYRTAEFDRNEGAPGWSDNGKDVTKLEDTSVRHLVPTCLSEQHAQHLFGERTTHIRSARNAVPGLKIEVGAGLLAPAIASQDKWKVWDIDEYERLHAPSSSVEQWMYKNLSTAFEEDGLTREEGPILFLKEFGTPDLPARPDRRYAYFHLLLNFLKDERYQDSDDYPRSSIIIQEMMEEERWGLPAPLMRKSTIVKMAQTIAFIDDPSWFKAGFDNTANSPQDADTINELDMLVVNIIEEHLFPSPQVAMTGGLNARPVGLEESDMIAEMQRR